jgi:hypothetical protein
VDSACSSCSRYLRSHCQHVRPVRRGTAACAGAISAARDPGGNWRSVWESRKKWQRTLLLVLLVWLGNESARAGLGPMGYFNEFALPDPSRILVSGCDLDCGQDAYRLANQLRERHVASVHLALWTSVDLRQIGLPRYDLLEAGKPVTGWVAIGMRSLRLGDVGHESHSVDAFSWLEAYKPVAYAGTTIRIYCIPDQTRGVSNVCPTH